MTIETPPPPGRLAKVFSETDDKAFGQTTWRTINVTHVIIRSDSPFEVVKGRLEASVPPLDLGFYEFMRKGEKDRTVAMLEALSPLSIFSSRDHGSLLMIADLRRRAVQYEIGNPLTASKMTRLRISAALYAPIRVLLRKNENDEVAFEYDRPTSFFGQFGDGQVDVVAQQLDADLQAALEAAAA